MFIAERWGRDPPGRDPPSETDIWSKSREKDIKNQEHKVSCKLEGESASDFKSPTMELILNSILSA